MFKAIQDGEDHWRTIELRERIARRKLLEEKDNLVEAGKRIVFEKHVQELKDERIRKANLKSIQN